MRKTAMPNKEVLLSDDLQLQGIANGLELTITRLKLKSSTFNLRFGPTIISAQDYANALQTLLQSLQADLSGMEFFHLLTKNFDAYEVYGGTDWGQVLVTSYFWPTIQGSIQPTSLYNQPIYNVPDDLVTINFRTFAKTIPSYEKLYQFVLNDTSRDAMIRGRLQDKDFIPYYSRTDIDSQKILQGKNLEIAYVNPIDAFFLHIQGSGSILLDNNQEMVVGYAQQNGHPYVPIGKFLLDSIPKEKMSMQSIQEHLVQLPIEDQQIIMNKNPSYVFFKKLESAPMTRFGVPVIEGRTIASDEKFYPKGGFAFLEYEKPQIEDGTLKTSHRFVFDHDVGGAIRGTHRVDLFWGKGAQAAKISGVMKDSGRLIYFVPKNFDK